MGVDRSRRQKQKRKEQGFYASPRNLLKSPDFRELSAWAVKLYFHFASQYNGYNNGKLTAVYSELLRDLAFLSPTRIVNAKRELTEKGFIRQTAIGNKRTKEPDRFAILKPSLGIDWTANADNIAMKPP
ncbi:MAG: hypothetical protein IKI30_02665 [Oxalobacter sp.]|nr:hypothetical protein [Oxalobacter sp.]